MSSLPAVICQNCQQADATVFWTSIVSGIVSQESLCANCATPVMVLRGIPHPDALKCHGRGKFKFQVTLTPDPCRPSTFHLPARISLEDLAESLRIKAYQVIGLLIEIDDWARPDDKIEFKSAAHVCKRCGVTAVEATKS